MKILFSLLFVFILGLSISAQTKTFESLEKENKSFKKNKCKITYDKFKDFTTVSSSPILSNIMLSSFVVSFGFDGQVLSEPTEFYLVSFTSASLFKDTSLIFIANGERVNIGGAYVSNQRTKIMSVADGYVQLYKFTPQQLEKFASAEKIEFQIDNNEFTTQKDVSEKIKNLLALSKLR